MTNIHPWHQLNSQQEQHWRGGWMHTMVYKIWGDISKVTTCKISFTLSYYKNHI